MVVLEEEKTVKQHSGEKKRRWFRDKYFDLIVWYESEDDIYGFQLCYDISQNEHALTWKQDKGFLHEKIDTGEHLPFKNLTPILLPDGVFPAEYIVKRFSEESKKMEESVRKIVIEKLKVYSKENVCYLLPL